MNKLDHAYSYAKFIEERAKFKIVDAEGINRFDTPATLYFKILFYFSEDNGLLCSDFNAEGILNEEMPGKNTAYNFLLRNYENERAELLKDFIQLLSNINSYSPWYFQEISGLDAALERKMFSEHKVTIDEQLKELSIKCLQDAYDNRIATLLEMYRVICFSYKNKKEIVPANLRKFNMGILVFNAPILGYGGKASPDSELNNPVQHIKLIEFKNCEFDYNSSTSGLTTLNAADGPNSPEYTIKIKYHDCFESRHNRIMDRVISDFLASDINLKAKNEQQQLQDELNEDENIKVPEENKTKIGQQTLYGPISIKEIDKTFWTNSNLKTAETPKELKGIIADQDIKVSDMEIGSFAALRPFTNQVKLTTDRVKELMQAPTITESMGNIHDNWSSNQSGNYGKYEYLNRINGMNGIMGQALSASITKPLSEVEKQLKKMYLGNIRGNSIEDNIKESLKGKNIYAVEEKTTAEPVLKNQKLPNYIAGKTSFNKATNKAKTYKNTL